MTEFSASSLLAIFPPALKKSPDYWLMAQVIAPELERAFQLAELAAVMPRIDEQPENVLDALARDLSIDWWKPDADLAAKRLGVKSALVGHARLGTLSAVQNAVDIFLGGGTVEEWSSYNGEPFHYRITGADNAEILANYDAFLRVLAGVTRFSAVMDDLEEAYLLDENDQKLMYSSTQYLTT